MIDPKKAEKVNVWDGGKKPNFLNTRYVISGVNGGFCVAVSAATELAFLSNEPFMTTIWNHWEPIPKKRLMNRDEAMDFVSGDPKKRVRNADQPWQLPASYSFTAPIKHYEWSDYDPITGYGEAHKFEVEE